MKLFIFALLASLVVIIDAQAQIFTLTPDQLIKYTPLNHYGRFPDGRPKVPDALLEKVKGLSETELLGLQRLGYRSQYADGFQVLHPGKKLIGRALTLQTMPTRPDIESVYAAERKAKGLPGPLQNQTGIDLLQRGDVWVCDAMGGDLVGIIGDNLAYYIWKSTGNGYVIEGAIRDLEGQGEIDMPGYFRGTSPGAKIMYMVTGIDVPVKIGNVMVMPGDVVLGDREGVWFIPPHLVEQLVAEADINHIHDEWARKKVDEGKYKASDIYSPKDPALIKEYQDYLKQRLGASAYEEYLKKQSGR
jgi:regulator of RNase E activity RraA